MDSKTSCIILILIHLVSICLQCNADGSFEIWIFKNMELRPTGLTSYEDFNSKNVYIVRVREQNARTRLPDIFCWVGANSSKEDTALAIISAFAKEGRFANFNLSKGIRQESQGRESRHFKEIFALMPADELSKKSDTQKPLLAETRMILVKLRSRDYDESSAEDPNSWKIAALEEVEFSSAYLDKNVCLIAFHSKMVYLHCKNKKEPTYNEEYVLKRTARFLADKILKEMDPTAEVFSTITDSSRDSQDKMIQQLTQEFHDISEAKLEHKDKEHQSLESGLKLSPMNLTVRRILRGGFRGISNQDFTRSLLLFLSLAHHECYVVDLGSEVFNTLVWIGKDTDVDVRRECISDVNSRAKKGSSIIYIDEKYTTLTKESFRLRAEDFIRTMDRVYESWTDIFHSMHEGPDGFGKF